MSEKVSIIIVHHDEPEYLNILLQSIKVCSLEHDYIINVIDNNSKEQKSINFINNLKSRKDINIIENDSEISFRECLYKGIEESEESDYFVFSHSDNVILNKQWLDYMIGLFIDNKKIGAICDSKLIEFTGPNSQTNKGPNYNFLMTPTEIFNAVGKFKYNKCNNIGLFLGYHFQLQVVGLETIGVYNVINHYSLGSISQEQKIEDIKLFNQQFVDHVSEK